MMAAKSVLAPASTFATLPRSLLIARYSRGNSVRTPFSPWWTSESDPLRSELNNIDEITNCGKLKT